MLPKLERSAERMREGAGNGRKGERERSAVVKKKKEEGGNAKKRRGMGLTKTSGGVRISPV